MNELQIFKNVEFGEVRTVTIDNEPWFVGKDVAEALGYSDTNKAVAMHVENDDKKLNDKTSPSFGQRGATLINESGLYALIFGSKLESAKRFKHWVTSEVLPALRETGSYEIPKKDTDRKEKLSSVNQMAKNVKSALYDAGVDSKYIAAEVVRIYSDNGYPVKVPLISDVPVLWDCTTIAKELGILSESGRPHDKAVSAIIQKIPVSEDEIVKTAYSRKGHDGVTVQYKDSVMAKVRGWLSDNGYPTVIEYLLSNGNTNKCKVVYQEVA